MAEATESTQASIVIIHKATKNICGKGGGGGAFTGVPISDKSDKSDESDESDAALAGFSEAWAVRLVRPV